MRIVLLFVVVLLAGCAGTSKPPPVGAPKAISLAQGGNTGTIYLNRANAPQLGYSTADVLLDGKKIGTIENGQCVRLTVPAGSRQLTVSASAFGNFGAALGSALVASMNLHNAKIKGGEVLHFSTKPYYDGPQTGWIMSTLKQKSGRTC